MVRLELTPPHKVTEVDPKMAKQLGELPKEKSQLKKLVADQPVVTLILQEAVQGQDGRKSRTVNGTFPRDCRAVIGR